MYVLAMQRTEKVEFFILARNSKGIIVRFSLPLPPFWEKDGHNKDKISQMCIICCQDILKINVFI